MLVCSWTRIICFCYIVNIFLAVLIRLIEIACLRKKLLKGNRFAIVCLTTELYNVHLTEDLSIKHVNLTFRIK